MDLRLMSLNIREFCPDLSIPVIRQRINIRYKQILAAESWEFLNDSTTVRLIGIHESGDDADTVAVPFNSVTVTGTSTKFTDANIGAHIRIDAEAQPYVISAVGSSTSLTLETSYGGSTQTEADYNLYKTIYTPVVGDVDVITSIVYQSPLAEKSDAFLNIIDPERSSTGSPVYWRNFSKTRAHGLVSFEIWPTPDQDYVITVFYKKLASELTAGTDEPIFRAEVLEAGALWDCYRLAFAKTKNNTYVGLARDARNDFSDLQRQMLIEDLAISSLPNRVRDVSGVKIWDDNFFARHDTEGI